MDFYEFKRELTKASLDSTHLDDVKKDFAKLAQTGPTAKYVEAFRKWDLHYNACSKLTNVNYYSDAILLDAFMTGLKKEVLVHVKMAEPVSLQAACNAAKDAEAIYTPPVRQTVTGTASCQPVRLRWCRIPASLCLACLRVVEVGAVAEVAEEEEEVGVRARTSSRAGTKVG
eukprot:2002750-Rhodomonas_salina.2